MRKINEIFYSLQGEGYHTGTPAVFIRFSGCNLKCDFCDTRHEEGEMMTDEDIVNEIGKYPAVMVILTGGEPSLWIDDAFIDLFAPCRQVCMYRNQWYETLARCYRLGDLLSQAGCQFSFKPDG